MISLITGASGTVGSALVRLLQSRGQEVRAWDRGRAHPGDEHAAGRFIEEVGAGCIYHLALPSRPTGADNEGWLVNEKWTADLAAIAGRRGIPFVYASTVMVFTNNARGPFPPHYPPDETQGYGASKLAGERAAISANPDARVARLGWQIADEPGSNHMVDFLERHQSEHGHVNASTRWLPATSHVADTADALVQVASLPPSTYHVNSNTRWNYHQIVCALNRHRGGRWEVRANEDFVYDQRLLDARLKVRPLEVFLPFE